MPKAGPATVLEFYGMCCAAPRWKEQMRFRTLDVLLPEMPRKMEHHARLMIPTEWVVFEYGGRHADVADHCIATAGGETYYAWDLEGWKLTVDFRDSRLGKYQDAGLGECAQPTSQQEVEDVRWLPSLGNLVPNGRIPGANRQVRKGFVRSVVCVRGGGGVVQSGLGSLMSMFDFKSGSQTKDRHVVAERIVYAAGARSLPTLRLQRGRNKRKVIQVAPGTATRPPLRIVVSHLPLMHRELVKGDELEHFRHFYKLLSQQRPARPRALYDGYVHKPTSGQASRKSPSLSLLSGGRPVQCGASRA